MSDAPAPAPEAWPLPPALRDTAAMLERVRAEWGGRGDLWVFGYASLIWRPEFESAEHRPAQVRGWHRAFRMRSRVNRGTPERPGLVYALVSGGTCRGMVYRIPQARASAELDRLWLREMPTGVYDPRWLRCETASGPVAALAFTLSRRSPHFTGPIADTEMLNILRHAHGRYGSTLDYLVHTAETLHQHRMCDRESARLLALVRRQGLVADPPQRAEARRAAAVPGAPATRPPARSAARSASVSTSTSTPASGSSTPTDG